MVKAVISTSIRLLTDLGYLPAELIRKRCYNFRMEKGKSLFSAAVEQANKGAGVSLFENQYHRKIDHIAIHQCPPPSVCWNRLVSF
jgi:hypothetical protein